MNRELQELLILMFVAWFGGILFLISVQVLYLPCPVGIKVGSWILTASLFIGCLNFALGVT